MSGPFRNETEQSPHFSQKTREMGHPTHSTHTRGRCPALLERLDRGSFAVFHVEHGVELGNLKQIIDFLGEVQELEFAALILGRGEGADQFTDARTVDIVDVLQVQNNLLVPFGEDIAHRVAENDAAFAEGDATAAIHNRNSIHLPTANLHGHWEASLPPADGPWTCLISLSSVPVWEGRISTTSINERIRKIPRPDVLSRFSGAKGFGILLKSIPGP